MILKALDLLYKSLSDSEDSQATGSPHEPLLIFNWARLSSHGASSRLSWSSWGDSMTFYCKSLDVRVDAMDTASPV